MRLGEGAWPHQAAFGVSISQALAGAPVQLWLVPVTHPSVAVLRNATRQNGVTQVLTPYPL